MVAPPAGSGENHDSLKQQVRRGREESQFLQWDFLGTGALRPAMGAGAAGVWDDPVYEFGEYGEKGIGENYIRKYSGKERAQPRLSFPDE